MIYTLTLNPAVDVFNTISSPLQEEEVNRADSQTLKAAGKGINCSILLDTLKVRSTAVALLGGFSGAFIAEALQKHKLITVCSVPLKGENRINTKLIRKHTSISINALGVTIDHDTKKQLFQTFTSLTEDDCVMLCGSLILGFTDEDLLQLCSLIKQQQAYLIIDCEALTLPLLEKIQPDLIKPNLYELSLLLQRKLTFDNLSAAISEVLSVSEAMIVSLGADGAVYADRSQRLRLTHEKMKVENTVGCGDALLAGFVAGYRQSFQAAEALQLGGACACAHVEANDHTYDQIMSYLNRMRVSAF